MNAYMATRAICLVFKWDKLVNIITKFILSFVPSQGNECKPCECKAMTVSPRRPTPASERDTRWISNNDPRFKCGIYHIPLSKVKSAYTSKHSNIYLKTHSYNLTQWYIRLCPRPGHMDKHMNWRAFLNTHPRVYILTTEVHLNHIEGKYLGCTRSC